MDMIGLDSQRKNEPALFLTLSLDNLLATFFEIANKNSFAQPWTPDETINNQMYSLLISLVF